MAQLPTMFVSHGAPTLAVEESPARSFLREYGKALGKPEAILVASAHWATRRPAVSGMARPETIHDFGGFDPALYQIRYPAPGAPRVAKRVTDLLGRAGLAADIDERRGLDHGAWVPLSLMYPAADIPALQLSIQPQADAGHHFRLGKALRPLRDEGILILGSGSATHNLNELSWNNADAAAPPWAIAFQEWIAAAVAAGRVDDLIAYRRLAPHAARSHPTDEHLLPLFVALGAATPGVAGTRVHASHTYGSLAMDAYVFS